MVISIQEMVSREVLYCVSVLISDLAKIVPQLPYKLLQETSLDDDELRDLLQRDDWEEPVCWHIDNEMSRSDLIDALDAAGVDDPRVDMRLAPEDRGEPWAGADIKELRAELLKHLVDEGEIEDFAREHDIEPYTVEVYEHWIVTNWLAEKLLEKGEVVGEVAGMVVWGRCITGQRISMDGVIREIYKDLTGQEADE